MSGSSATPSRAELAACTRATLKPAVGLSAAVLLVDTPEGPAVVKDWAAGGRWGRLLGPGLARREARVYAALTDHPAVPRYLGRVDRHAFAVEHRPGRRISRRHRRLFSPSFGAALEQAVRGLHARGVVHLDLRHRRNVRCDAAGRPVLIDFGASLRFRPGGWRARWLLPWLARIDLGALAKWRHLLGTAPLRGCRPAQLPPEPAGAESPSPMGRGISRPT